MSNQIFLLMLISIALTSLAQSNDVKSKAELDLTPTPEQISHSTISTTTNTVAPASFSSPKSNFIDLTTNSSNPDTQRDFVVTTISPPTITINDESLFTSDTRITVGTTTVEPNLISAENLNDDNELQEKHFTRSYKNDVFQTTGKYTDNSKYEPKTQPSSAQTRIETRTTFSEQKNEISPDESNVQRRKPEALSQSYTTKTLEAVSNLKSQQTDSTENINKKEESFSTRLTVAPLPVSTSTDIEMFTEVPGSTERTTTSEYSLPSITDLLNESKDKSTRMESLTTKGLYIPTKSFTEQEITSQDDADAPDTDVFNDIKLRVELPTKTSITISSFHSDVPLLKTRESSKNEVNSNSLIVDTSASPETDAFNDIKLSVASPTKVAYTHSPEYSQPISAEFTRPGLELNTILPTRKTHTISSSTDMDVFDDIDLLTTTMHSQISDFFPTSKFHPVSTPKKNIKPLSTINNDQGKATDVTSDADKMGNRNITSPTEALKSDISAITKTNLKDKSSSGYNSKDTQSEHDMIADGYTSPLPSAQTASTKVAYGTSYEGDINSIDPEIEAKTTPSHGSQFTLSDYITTEKNNDVKTTNKIGEHNYAIYDPTLRTSTEPAKSKTEENLKITTSYTMRTKNEIEGTVTGAFKPHTTPVTKTVPDTSIPVNTDTINEISTDTTAETAQTIYLSTEEYPSSTSDTLPTHSVNTESTDDFDIPGPDNFDAVFKSATTVSTPETSTTTTFTEEAKSPTTYMAPSDLPDRKPSITANSTLATGSDLNVSPTVVLTSSVAAYEVTTLNSETQTSLHVKTDSAIAFSNLKISSIQKDSSSSLPNTKVNGERKTPVPTKVISQLTKNSNDDYSIKNKDTVNHYTDYGVTSQIDIDIGSSNPPKITATMGNLPSTIRNIMKDSMENPTQTTIKALDKERKTTSTSNSDKTIHFSIQKKNLIKSSTTKFVETQTGGTESSPVATSSKLMNIDYHGTDKDIRTSPPTIKVNQLQTKQRKVLVEGKNSYQSETINVTASTYKTNQDSSKTTPTLDHSALQKGSTTVYNSEPSLDDRTTSLPFDMTKHERIGLKKKDFKDLNKELSSREGILTITDGLIPAPAMGDPKPPSSSRTSKSTLLKPIMQHRRTGKKAMHNGKTTMRYKKGITETQREELGSSEGNRKIDATQNPLKKQSTVTTGEIFEKMLDNELSPTQSNQIMTIKQEFEEKVSMAFPVRNTSSVEIHNEKRKLVTKTGRAITLANTSSKDSKNRTRKENRKTKGEIFSVNTTSYQGEEEKKEKTLNKRKQKEQDKKTIRKEGSSIDHNKISLNGSSFISTQYNDTIVPIQRNGNRWEVLLIVAVVSVFIISSASVIVLIIMRKKQRGRANITNVVKENEEELNQLL